MARPRWAFSNLVAAAMLAAVWALPASARQAAVTANGADLFRSYCVSCHGTDATGTGPLAASLSRKPANLTSLSTINGGEFPSELVGRIIDGRDPVKGHGGGDMPVWGEALLRSRAGGSEAAVKEQIDALVDYLRTVQRPAATHR